MHLAWENKKRLFILSLFLFQSYILIRIISYGIFRKLRLFFVLMDRLEACPAYLIFMDTPIISFRFFFFEKGKYYREH